MPQKQLEEGEFVHKNPGHVVWSPRAGDKPVEEVQRALVGPLV